MASCNTCGASVEGGLFTCPKCGATQSASMLSDPSMGLDKLASFEPETIPLGDALLDALGKSTQADMHIGATHHYEIVARYEIGPDRRPVSAVLHGDELIVLSLTAAEDVILDRFSSDGSSLGTVGPLGAGTATGPIGEPAGLALDEAGNLFLLDAGEQRVLKLSASGELLDTFDGDTETLLEPRDIEVTPRGMLLADTEGNRIVLLDPSGTPVLTIGPEIDEDDDDVFAGEEPGEFDEPRGVTADDKGFIYVADTNNHRIQVFDPDGEFVREFGEEGSWAGSMTFPTDVRVDSAGGVFVFDLHGRRIQKFDPAGESVWSFVLEEMGPEAVDATAGDIDIGPDESVYVPLPSEGTVLRVVRMAT